jgi:hypothetical protein
MGKAALKSIAGEEYHKVVDAPELAITPFKKQVKRPSHMYACMIKVLRCSSIGF